MKEWRECGGQQLGGERRAGGRESTGRGETSEHQRTRAPSNKLLSENKDEITSFKKKKQTTKEETCRKGNNGKGAGEKRLKDIFK